MMVLYCGSCQKQVSIREVLEGRQVFCPDCGQALLVPTAVPCPVSSSTISALTQGEPVAQDAVTQPPPQVEEPTSSPSPGSSSHDASLTNFLAPSQADDELGRLGGFRILQILGHGGMGVVYLGEDPKLGRKVAIKVMLPYLAQSPSAQQRFLQEARAAAALEHDHIVPIFHVGEDCGATYIVMPFLKGEPLDRRLQRDHQLPIAEVLRIGREVASGLAAAHTLGLIHRDIKPANIWLEAPAQRAKILDFGLARVAAKDAGLTQQGAIVGTPAYMAPEQGRGEPVDARSDLWSLGVVLYRACTGRQPFTGKDSLTTLLAVVQHQPPPLVQLNTAVPPGLSDLVMQLLAKAPEQRFASAQEVVEALHELEEQQEKTQTSAAPLSQPIVRRRPRSRIPLWLALGALLVVLVALLGPLRGILWAPEDTPPITQIVATETNDTKNTGDAKETNNTKETKETKKADPTKKVEPPKTKSGKQESVKVPGKDPLPQKFKNNLGMEFVLVPKGKSWLGGGGGKPGTREGKMPRNFYLGAFEVTQEEWQNVMGGNPSRFSRSGHDHVAVKSISDRDLKRFPVENISWHEAQTFLAKLNERDRQPGWRYRLPKEAEWEYACRGGPLTNKTESAFDYYFAKPTNQITSGLANYHFHLKRPCKVGTFPPNRLGLYDMHGNVSEWCLDDALPGPKGEIPRVSRGGDWTTLHCPAVQRGLYAATSRHNYRGLRVARVAVEK